VVNSVLAPTLKRQQSVNRSHMVATGIQTETRSPLDLLSAANCA